jgi:hypothetical protein
MIAIRTEMPMTGRQLVSCPVPPIAAPTVVARLQHPPCSSSAAKAKEHIINLRGREWRTKVATKRHTKAKATPLLSTRREVTR